MSKIYSFLTMLTVTAVLSFVAMIGGLLVGKWTVIENANEITTKATQEMVNRVRPAIEQLNEQARALNVKVEGAQLWNELTEGMSFEQKPVYIKQAQEAGQAARANVEGKRAGEAVSSSSSAVTPNRGKEDLQLSREHPLPNSVAL